MIFKDEDNCLPRHRKTCAGHRDELASPERAAIRLSTMVLPSEAAASRMLAIHSVRPPARTNVWGLTLRFTRSAPRAGHVHVGWSGTRARFVLITSVVRLVKIPQQPTGEKASNFRVKKSVHEKKLWPLRPA